MKWDILLLLVGNCLSIFHGQLKNIRIFLMRLVSGGEVPLGEEVVLVAHK